MNHKLYKPIITLIAICFLGYTYAQKFDKKFTENFKVNKDVEVAINASNTEINVTTWNKNEVQVQGYIEIEGLSKEKAEKYFKNWNFEALGNRSKVKITSQGNNSLGLRNDFVIFNNMDFNFPDIQMPNLDSIIIPDMNFNFDIDFDYENLLEDLDDLDLDMGENGNYSFQWNDDDTHIIIKSKKEWETFKKSKQFKELKKKMSVNKVKMKKSIAETKEKMKEGLAKAKLEYQKVDKTEIKRALSEAKKHIMEMKLNFNSDSNNITIDGKKIKIIKRLEIKVPKNATFDLNTRHCKVKLPNTVAFGKVSYGDFNVANLSGGKLSIDYSKVSINDLKGCTLSLNNVTDAKIASVTNATMNNNSSGIHILKINNDVKIYDEFGDLTIEDFNPKFGEFILNLSHTNATLNLVNTNCGFKYNVNNVKLENKRAALLKENNINNNIINVNGDYSNLIIK
jgi:hypothetical protein